jgi:uncharacterized membrane protein
MVPGRRKKSPTVTGTARKNIESVSHIEHEFASQRSTLDRFSDAITRFAGSFQFIAAHAICFVGWSTLNSLERFGVHPFDPYPFSLINLVIVMEAFFLSTFILMSQSRQERKAEQRDHLDLQIGLLAEQEATKMLQLLQALCNHAGLPQATKDKELVELIKTTEVSVLAEELKKMHEEQDAIEKNRPE